MYAIFFDYDNTTIELPTNPEEIEVSSSQAVDKYEVLKLGQIAIPTHMELKEYSFECEFPFVDPKDYVRRNVLRGLGNIVNRDLAGEIGKYPSAESYIQLFTEWRDKLIPVRFLAGRVTQQGELYPDSISILVLMEDLTIKEKAGEEGDKYISFKLLEYREFGKIATLDETKKLKVKESADKTNPKNTGSYVVQKGDCLWAIAKKYYGDGSKYTKIYNANKDKIKNPSLIYPGQKLVIP